MCSEQVGGASGDVPKPFGRDTAGSGSRVPLSSGPGSGILGNGRKKTLQSPRGQGEAWHSRMMLELK